MYPVYPASLKSDGKDALPGAVECLEELRRMGKRLVILSNTSKREAFTMNRLPQFGFRQELFDGGVTSGEVWRHDAWSRWQIYKVWHEYRTC